MNYRDIEEGIVQLIKKAETELPKDVINALKHAYEIEEGVAKTQIEEQTWLYTVIEAGR